MAYYPKAPSAGVQTNKYKTNIKKYEPYVTWTIAEETKR